MLSEKSTKSFSQKTNKSFIDTDEGCPNKSTTNKENNFPILQIKEKLNAKLKSSKPSNVKENIENYMYYERKKKENIKTHTPQKKLRIIRPSKNKLGFQISEESAIPIHRKLTETDVVSIKKSHLLSLQKIKDEENKMKKCIFNKTTIEKDKVEDAIRKQIQFPYLGQCKAIFATDMRKVNNSFFKRTLENVFEKCTNNIESPLMNKHNDKYTFEVEDTDLQHSEVSVKDEEELSISKTSFKEKQKPANLKNNVSKIIVGNRALDLSFSRNLNENIVEINVVKEELCTKVDSDSQYLETTEKSRGVSFPTIIEVKQLALNENEKETYVKINVDSKHSGDTSILNSEESKELKKTIVNYNGHENDETVNFHSQETKIEERASNYDNNVKSNGKTQLSTNNNGIKAYPKEDENSMIPFESNLENLVHATCTSEIVEINQQIIDKMKDTCTQRNMEGAEENIENSQTSFSQIDETSNDLLKDNLFSVELEEKGKNIMDIATRKEGAIEIEVENTNLNEKNNLKFPNDDSYNGTDNWNKFQENKRIFEQKNVIELDSIHNTSPEVENEPMESHTDELYCSIKIEEENKSKIEYPETDNNTETILLKVVYKKDIPKIFDKSMKVMSIKNSKEFNKEYETLPTKIQKGCIRKEEDSKKISTSRKRKRNWKEMGTKCEIKKYNLRSSCIKNI